MRRRRGMGESGCRRRLGTLLAAPLVLSACGESSGTAAAGVADGGGEQVTTLHPSAAPLPGQAACTVVETTDIPEPNFTHLPICTPITYSTPPNGGDHWPIWAAFKKYVNPVPREMYVHDLEHGAIVFLYKCDGACPDVVQALGEVFDGFADPLCLSTPGAPPARVVLTSDPELTTPIAASAWGQTYTATCIDVPSLRAFANAHYGNGREPLCYDGIDTDGTDVCPPGGGGG